MREPQRQDKPDGQGSQQAGKQKPGFEGALCESVGTLSSEFANGQFHYPAGSVADVGPHPVKKNATEHEEWAKEWLVRMRHARTHDQQHSYRDKSYDANR